MFGEEKQSEELKAFEAELASLRPRSDGLDPRWRFLLAQEATLNQNLPVSHALAAGRFVCSRCGGALSGGRGKSHWAWPAAFSAMTAVAAVLLVTIAVRVDPRIAAPGDGKGVSTADASLAERPGDLHSSLVVRNLPRPQRFSGSGETAYLSLRDQVLRFGVESWKSPASAAAVTTRAAEPVLSCHGQLEALLIQEDGS
jgi:hypothetical protein